MSTLTREKNKKQELTAQAAGSCHITIIKTSKIE